jgi:hypothetical protein
MVVDLGIQSILILCGSCLRTPWTRGEHTLIPQIGFENPSLATLITIVAMQIFIFLTISAVAVNKLRRRPMLLSGWLSRCPASTSWEV